MRRVVRFLPTRVKMRRVALAVHRPSPVQLRSARVLLAIFVRSSSFTVHIDHFTRAVGIRCNSILALVTDLDIPIPGSLSLCQLRQINRHPSSITTSLVEFDLICLLDSKLPHQLSWVGGSSCSNLLDLQPVELLLPPSSPTSNDLFRTRSLVAAQAIHFSHPIPASAPASPGTRMRYALVILR